MSLDLMSPAAQMYTLRDFTKTVDDLRNALCKVAEMGYVAVQLSAIGAWDAGLVDAAGMRQILQDMDLVCCATHRPLKRLLEKTDEEIEIHQTLGCDYVAVGSIASDYGMEPDSYRRFLDDFRPVMAAFKEEGIRFGFHNHALEFRQRGVDHYDLLLEEPDLQLEVDVYWVAVAGLDPSALLRRAAGKIAAVHFKDLEVVGWEAPTFAPVGEGNLDWDSIIATCREGGTEWAIVEQDTCRRDPFDCLASSFRFLKTNGC